MNRLTIKMIYAPKDIGGGGVIYRQFDKQVAGLFEKLPERYNDCGYYDRIRSGEKQLDYVLRDGEQRLPTACYITTRIDALPARVFCDGESRYFTQEGDYVHKKQWAQLPLDIIPATDQAWWKKSSQSS